MDLVVDIKKKYKDFNLEIKFESGQDTLGILGSSGSGKSMTLRAIAGIVTPDQGRIILNGRTLFDSDKGINLAVQERRVGLLFQNYALFPNLTVRENIEFGIRKLPEAQRMQRVEDKLTAMQIEHLQDKYPYQLSGGEQQRTALARTLVTEPECLLLDEPFSALDNHIRARLEKELLDIFSGFDGVKLFVTHNLEECYRVSKNIMVIDRGKALFCGCRDEIFQNPKEVRTARLTGCKNISTMSRIGKDRVEAREWACILTINKENGKDHNDQINTDNLSGYTHIGIRDHDIKPAADKSLPNTFPCLVKRTIETPFAVTCFLKIEGTAGDNGEYQLQMEISKEEYSVMKTQPFPWYVQLKPEKMLLLKG